MEKIILYTTHCPKCLTIEKRLADNNIKHKEDTNIENIREVASKNKIDVLPFADINGKLYTTAQLELWINNKVNGECK